MFFVDDFSSVLKRKILDGHKPQRPKSMSYSIYYLLLKCWDLQPDIRPSYIDIEVRYQNKKFVLFFFV